MSQQPEELQWPSLTLLMGGIITAPLAAKVDAHIAAQSARIRELEASLNAAIEASSIAEFGRLTAEAQVSKLRAEQQTS